MGGIPKEITSKHVEVLLGHLNNNVEELIFKHAAFNTKGSETFAWITLTPETSILTPRTMRQIKLTE